MPSIDLIIQILGFTLGLIYLFFEYRADSRMWIVGIVMPVVSMIVYFRKGLYADFGMGFYYFSMAVYGYLAWTGLLRKKEDNKKKTLKISHVPAAQLAGVVAATALIWAAIALFLDNATDSNVPLADGFTTAVSITATWMLARKYVEQWIAWIIVDLVGAALYLYKGIYPYTLLNIIYSIVAVAGYLKWRRMIADDSASAAGTL